MEYKSEPIPTKYDDVIVSVHEYQGVDRLDIRHYYTNRSGERLPSKKGVSVKLSEAKSVIDAVNAVIALFKAGSREPMLEPATTAYMPVRVKIDEYKGVKRLDIRHYWKPENSTTLKPSDKGAGIPIDQLDRLSEILNKVASEFATASASPIEDPALPQKSEEEILSELGFMIVPDKRFSMIEA